MNELLRIKTERIKLATAKGEVSSISPSEGVSMRDVKAGYGSRAAMSDRSETNVRRMLMVIL